MSRLIRGQRHRRKSVPGHRRHRIFLETEALETRQLLSAFTVSSPSDDGSTHTLRWAVEQADAAGSDSSIEIELGTMAATITLSQGALDLTNTTYSVTIYDGPGQGPVTVSGNAASQVFQVSQNVTASISGVTFTGGSASGGSLSQSRGGAIYNQGDLTITDCTISGSSAEYGGGLANDGTATLNGCTISGNSARGGGGGLASVNGSGYGALPSITLTDCTISANTAGSGGGGGVSNYGEATITNCNISGNVTISNYSAGDGGGVENAGTLTLTGSAINSNTAGSDGGGLANQGTADLTSCTISGNIAVTDDGGGINDLGKSLTLAYCAITGNSAASGGGAIFANGDTAASLTACTISGNEGYNGGGLEGGAYMTDCTIYGNSALYYGGGVMNFGNGKTGNLTACTVSGNYAGKVGGGIFEPGFGSYPLALTDTIVAGDTGHLGAASDIGGSTSGITGTYDLIGPGGSGGIGGGSNGNIVLSSLSNLDLGPLANNGGPTETMALLPGSAAIQAGTEADYPGTSKHVTSDQRGDLLDSPPDIGAYQIDRVTIYTVNSTGNSATGTGASGTLPYLIALANANTNPFGSEIEFDPSVFSASSPQVIVLGATLVLSETDGTEVIDGPGAAVVSISGGNAVGVFQVASGVTASLTGLTIISGSVSGPGGGIYNQGDLSLTGCTISGNSAQVGGGIDDIGTATLNGCTISGNSAASGAGIADEGSLTLESNVSVSGSVSASGSGAIKVTGPSNTFGGALMVASGALDLFSGASLGVNGPVSVSGDTTIGGTLRIAGDLTLNSAATLNEQIGGALGSGQVGQIEVGDSAALSGTFNLDLVNGFNPSVGQDFPVLTYASAAGTFAAMNGLPQGMIADQGPAAFYLDVPAAPTISWTNPNGGEWDVPANWSTDVVPSSSDVVSINTAGTATITIQSGDEIQVQSLTTSDDDTLSITGGSLTVTVGVSTLSGPLSMTGGTLTATGSGVNLTANGATSIASANLLAEEGAALDLPQLTTYTSDSNTLLQADGADSLLDLSALTSQIQNSISYCDDEATNGGKLNLNGLASLTANGRIDFTDTGGSTLLDGKLSGLNAPTIGSIAVSIDGTDPQFDAAWTSFANSYLFVNGGNNTLPKVTNIDGSELMLSNSAILALPELTTLDSAYSDFGVDGSGGELDLSALTSLTPTGPLYIGVTDGATLNLSSLTSLSSTQTMNIGDTGGSKILDGDLTDLNGVNITLDGTDARVASAWRSFSGSITLTAGAVSLPEVATARFSGLEVDAGATLDLPLSTAVVTDTGDMSIGGTLDIAGNLTLTSASTLIEQIGGTPASGQFGRIVAGGIVTLAGTFDLDVLNGFTPSVGQDFPVITYANATGNFSTVTGLTDPGSLPLMEEVNAESVDLVPAPTPTVTNATTGENVQSSSGLVITPGSVDTSLITDFQITGIMGGSLFLNDGVTPATNGTFITAAQGAAGLKFTPTAGSLATGSFTVQDAFAANTAGLLGTSATATVTVLAPTFENVPTLLHGLATVSWSALGYNPATITVDITAYQAGQAIALAADQPLTGSCTWNTTSVPDGQYELQAVMHDASGNEVGQCQQHVAINNTAAWYSGTIAANETWTSAQVNVVSGNVTIPSGVTVTLEPGAIVKFADGTGITVQSGGTLNAAGATSAAPIIFTSLEDDTVGGDTNMDGGATLPVPGDWNGIAFQGSGSFLDNQYTQVRYQLTSFSGTLAASQTWLGTFTYEVPTELTIPSGVTLTIEPGAVVKFGAGTGITVQSGGQLIADGTVAQPIIFTSINDGSFGGDTNGGSPAPAPGDWGQILVNGSASFDHVEVFYGSGAGNNGITSGAILDSGGAVAFSDGVIGNALYDGLDTVYNGKTTISNSLFTNTDRAVVSTFSGATVSIVNSTFDGNVIGMYAHVGGSITAANCIVTGSSQYGVEADYGYQPPIVTYSDDWNTASGAVNYYAMTDPTGTNGDISANPRYVNAAGGDYRLNYLSPAIDSGNALVAPATDMLGDPMYNDPRTNPKTGVPSSSGTYADMGAYNFVESAPSNLDMIVTSVVGPATATAGGQAIIDWTDANTGTGTVIGPWHDSIYLVSNPGPNQVEILAAQLLVGQEVTLGPGQSCNLSATVEVPGDAAGTYFWAVEVNSAGDIFTGANTANTTLVSPAPVALSVPTLPIDAGTVSGQFSGVGSQEWYEFTPQAGQDIQVSLSMADTKGAAGIYIGLGYMPSAQHYDETQTQWNSSVVSALVPNTVAQPYYVLVQSIALSGASSAFTLTAHALGFELDSFSPTTINNTGPVTLQIEGGQLSAGLTYEITDSAGNTYTASYVNVINSSLVDATFDLDGIPTGGFSVSVTSPVQDPSQGGGNVVTGDPGNPNATVTVSPAEVKCGQPYTVTVKITNTGGSDVTLSMVQLSNGTSVTALSNSQFSSNGSTPVPTVTIAAGGDFQQSFPETAGQYPPGSSNSVDWTLSGGYAPQNQATTGKPVTTPPSIPLSDGDFAVGDATQYQSVNASLVQLVLNAQGFTAANNWTLNANTVVLNSGTPFNVTTYSLFPSDDGSEAGETMDFNIDDIANVPEPPVPNGSIPTLHWLQYLNEYPQVNGYGFQIVPLVGYWKMDNGNVPGGAASDPATGPYYDSNSAGGFSLPPTFHDSPQYYSGAGFYFHAVTIPTWDVFTPANGTTPASETIYVANYDLAWGFSIQAPVKLTASATEKVVQSGDPNDMQAGGFGPQGWIVGNQTIPYTIDFENMPTAAAPAAQVVITNQLSANLDWSTFQLEQIYFNNVEIQVPAGLQDYTTQVYVDTDPNPVDVTAAFNPDTGVVTWTMTSINPLTGQEVTDPLAGFLPPDNADFDGSGLVSYTIDPKAGLSSDTEITGQASIVFDVNASMETPQTLNTVDVTPPTSSVQPLPATESQTSFNVSWSGQDLLPDSSQGAGIASYNVYVSDDGAPFTLWQSDTTANSATFSGQFGNTYSFYSVAADNVGNVQPPPAAAQTTTYLVGLPTSVVAVLPATTTSTSFTVSWSGSPGVGATSIASYTIYESDDGGPFTGFLTDTTLTSTTFTGQFGHTYGFYSVATDNLGDIQPTPSAAQAKITVVITLPPPLVTVRSSQVETIKLGKGKKAKKETVLVLQFSGALNASAADNTGAYELAPVEKVKSTGKGKNKKPATSKLGKPVALASTAYNASNNQVTLTPRGTLNLTKPEELIVDGSLVTDALGREIDGNDDGQPGGDFIATITGSRVTVGGLPFARTQSGPASVADAIDRLLARDELVHLAGKSSASATGMRRYAFNDRVS